jgi:hypothetical protein
MFTFNANKFLSHTFLTVNLLEYFRNDPLVSEFHVYENSLPQKQVC